MKRFRHFQGCYSQDRSAAVSKRALQMSKGSYRSRIEQFRTHGRLHADGSISLGERGTGRHKALGKLSAPAARKACATIHNAGGETAPAPAFVVVALISET